MGQFNIHIQTLRLKSINYQPQVFGIQKRKTRQIRCRMDSINKKSMIKICLDLIFIIQNQLYYFFIYKKTYPQYFDFILLSNIRYGPDYNLISKQFEGIVEQKISTKFISQFCFNLNKKTYEIIVDYLKEHKQEKGQKQFNYDNLWPDKIDDPALRTQIQNLPTDIIRILNKDLSEAYNLLMESLSDPTLKKILQYNRIRDLYQFVTEIILKKKSKPKKQRKDKKDVKQNLNKKSISKIDKIAEKKNQQQIIVSETEWSSLQQRYFCALYLQRPLFKCCQKMSQKFGQSEKWDTTKKIFKKSEQIYEKALKKAFKSSYFKSLKSILDDLQINKECLLNQLVKKKTNRIEKIVLKYFKTVDSEKKSKILRQISTEILQVMQRPDILSKIPQQFEKIKKQTEKVKEEQKLPVEIDLEMSQPWNIQTNKDYQVGNDQIKEQFVSQIKIDQIDLEKNE